MGHPDLVGLVLGSEPAGHPDEIIDRKVINPARIGSVHDHLSRCSVNEVEHANLVVRSEWALRRLAESGAVRGDTGFHCGGHEAVVAHVSHLGCGFSSGSRPNTQHRSAWTALRGVVTKDRAAFGTRVKNMQVVSRAGPFNSV